MAADINVKGANLKDGYGPIKVWRLEIVGLLCHLRFLPPPHLPRNLLQGSPEIRFPVSLLVLLILLPYVGSVLAPESSKTQTHRSTVSAEFSTAQTHKPSVSSRGFMILVGTSLFSIVPLPFNKDYTPSLLSFLYLPPMQWFQDAIFLV